jgi:GTPase
LDPDLAETILNGVERDDSLAAISAITGEGADELLALIETKLTARQDTLSLDIPASDGATLSWIYRNGTVLDREDREEIVHIDVKLSSENVGRLEKMINITV